MLVIPETRGRKRKHFFKKVKVGQVQEFDETVNTILASLGHWKKAEGMDKWKFKAWTVDGKCYLARLK